VRWDQILVPWVARLHGDAALTALLGGEYIYPAQASRPVHIPSVEYLLIADIEGEWTNRISIQVDYWVRGLHDAAQVERRLRLLSHADYGQDLGGERLWFQYRDSRAVEYVASPGVVHRILEFDVECVREKYAA